MLRAAPLLILCLSTAACSSSVVRDLSGSASGSGGAASSSTIASSTVSTAGAGGFTSSTGTFASSTGSGSPMNPCPDAFIDLDSNDGSYHLAYHCAGSWNGSSGGESATPVAYVETGGKSASDLTIEGCGDVVANYPRLRMLVAAVDQPGDYAAGQVELWDAGNNDFSKTVQMAVHFDAIGQKPGELVTGSFDADVQHDEILVHMTSTFSVCRIDNLDLP